MISDFDRFVFVALPGQTEYVVAGRFRMSARSDGEPLGEFVYGHSYLTRRDAVELDPVQLRLTRRVRRTDGMFGALRDTMAISWGVRGTMDGPPDTGGALAFDLEPVPPAPKRRFSTIDDLATLQRAMDATPAGHDAHVEHPAPMGYRPVRAGPPKAIVEDQHTLWVAKFYGDDMIWNHARLRHATLQLARDCGLDVLPSRVDSIRGGGDVLMLQRYDRTWAGDGYACRRMISGLTLLGSDDTPTARRDWSYLALADEVRRTSAFPRVDLRELFGRMCFNAAVSNLGDDLGRPMMIAQGTGWRLCPWSSAVPTPLGEREHGNPSMIYGPYGRSPTRDNITAGARRFLVDKEAAEAIFDRIFEIVQSSWYDVLRRNGVSVQDCELVGRSIDSLRPPPTL